MEVELVVGCMDRFHKIHLFERMRKKPLDGKTLSGLRFNKKTNNLKT